MKKHNIILIVFLLVVVPALLATWGLTETSEARYAQISKEMFDRGDYLHPTLLEITHYHKPPMTYYITELGYLIFGVNETGARFFLMLALMTQLWFVYKISKSFFNDSNVAFVAMLLYFSYSIVQAAAKNLTTDCYLTSFIFASIYYYIIYRQKQEIIFLYLFSLCCGLAFLTKGPVGLMPQALFAIFYNRIQPGTGRAGFHLYTALLLGLLVCFSWFIMVVIDRPSLFNYFIKYQLVDRVASDTFNRTQPRYYYLLSMPVLSLPAFIYFFDFLRIKITGKRKTANGKSKMLLLIFGISLLVFSLSASKLVLYVLPLYLFMAMLSAMHLENMLPATRKVFEGVALIFSCLVFIAMIIACFVKLPIEIPKIPVIIIAAAGLVISTIVYRMNWTPVYVKGPLILALFMATLTFVFPFIMKKNELQINSIKPLAQFINAESTGKKAGTIAVYDQLLPSIAFYTGRKIITIDNGNSKAHRETQFESDQSNWKKTYIKIAGNKDSSVVTRLLNGPIAFLLAKKDNDIPDSLAYLRNGLERKTLIGKWVIYY